MSDLPQDVKEKIEEILQKDPGLLSQWEINFLNARRWVLNSEQKRIFASVLLPDEPTADGEKNVQVPQAKVTNPADLPPANTQYNTPVATGTQAPDVQASQPEGTNTGTPQEQVSPVNITTPFTSDGNQAPVAPENPYDADASKFDPAA